jgi:SnoaL-like polyketide cyclase
VQKEILFASIDDSPQIHCGLIANSLHLANIVPVKRPRSPDQSNGGEVQMFCGSKGAKGIMEKSKEIVRRAIEEIYNKNNTAEVDEIYADGYVFHCTTGPKIHSSEGVKELIQRRRAVLPNAIITIEDQVAEAAWNS